MEIQAYHIQVLLDNELYQYKEKFKTKKNAKKVSFKMKKYYYTTSLSEPGKLLTPEPILIKKEVNIIEKALKML